MQEKIISLTDFKTSASRLLQETRGGENIILTQNGSASAVVQDYETYRKQQDAFLMLKLLVDSWQLYDNSEAPPILLDES